MRLFANVVNAPIEMIARVSSVKRWHIISTTRQQTLAEHLALVAMLAGEIARRLGRQPTEYVQWGLYHDAAEVFLGDPPSPAKTEEHREREYEVLHSFAIPIPSVAIQDIVKICDLAEALRFIRTHKVDSYGEWAERHTRKSMLTALASLVDDDPDAIVVVSDVVLEYVYETRTGSVASSFHTLTKTLEGLEDRDRDDAPRNSGLVRVGAGHYSGLDRT